MRKILIFLLAGLLGFLVYSLIRKRNLIVYFSDADYPSVQLLSAYIRADVKKYSPATPIDIIFNEIKGYDTVIFLGGPAINPIYKYYMEKGLLPKIAYKGFVIKKIGNYIFIAGWDAEDTYKATKEYIRYES